MTVASTKASIAAGQTTSDAIDLGGGGRLMALILPGNWTAADITFLVSLDGTNFFTLYDNSDTAYTVQGGSSRAIQLTLQDFVAWQHVKLVSSASQVQAVQVDILMWSF